MSDCCDKQSMVIAIDIEFGKRDTAFSDDETASAIIDRIVHCGRPVGLNRESHRMEVALMLGKRDE